MSSEQLQSFFCCDAKWSWLPSNWLTDVGAVVLEMLAYNWEWKGISEVYFNATSSVGDIHHFAWRAKHPRWAQYADEDEARYAHWTPEECSSRYAARNCTKAVLLPLLLYDLFSALAVHECACSRLVLLHQSDTVQSDMGKSADSLALLQYCCQTL